MVEETESERVKRALVRSLMNWGVPRILVQDGNYRNSLQLSLQHAYEGFPLDDEYCRKTLEHLHYLWDRPVHLQTAEHQKGREQVKTYSYDEKGIHVSGA